ncbi:MAG: hypothetical protein EHM23_32775, partial [Acidobacteria bacterium]
MRTIGKKLKVITRLRLLCLVISCAASIAGTLADDPKPERLYLVKTIFIEPTNGIEKIKTIEACLQKELENKGFQVVDDRTAADGILRGTVEAKIVLDGGPGDVPKAIYEIQLKVREESIWKGRVKIRSKPTIAE